MGKQAKQKALRRRTTGNPWTAVTEYLSNFYQPSSVFRLKHLLLAQLVNNSGVSLDMTQNVPDVTESGELFYNPGASVCGLSIEEILEYVNPEEIGEHKVLVLRDCSDTKKALLIFFPPKYLTMDFCHP